MALIIDCQTFVKRGVLPNCLQTLNEIEVIPGHYVTNSIYKELTCISKYSEIVEVFVAMAHDLSRSHTVLDIFHF